nr:elongation factor Tu GTP binding domain protein [uncultured bacterium]
MEENHMKIINIGVLAHVDAGKTTLTESLLYNSGAITELGSVDKGTTRTDNTLLERQRGITIQTGITSFQWENTKVNIIDTPGHMDFLAEVYRSLSVLDGAILLISAKDGVQAQTREHHRHARTYGFLSRSISFIISFRWGNSTDFCKRWRTSTNSYIISCT